MPFDLRCKFYHVIVLWFVQLSPCAAAAPYSAILPSNNDITARQNNICADHAMGEFVKNPENCRLFYLCMDNEQAVMAACPPNLLFNPATKLCDTADHVDCDVESADGGNHTATNSSIQLNHNGTGSNNETLDAAQYCASLPANYSGVNFIGSRQSCQRYYICYHGRALLQECSENLHWNAIIGKCDLPEKAGCMVNNRLNGGQANGTGASLVGGVSTIGGLANGSSATDIGDSKQNNSLPNKISNTTKASSGKGALINCPTHGQHIFPHMERCDYYIYCVKGQAILQQCPFYYYFDVVTRNCQLRTTALCVQHLNINFRNLMNL